MSSQTVEIPQRISDHETTLLRPRMYKVLLHNDDYTTMQFVVDILMHVFRKSFEQASTLTQTIHEHGVGVAGIYPLEIAETKADTVHREARAAEFPLQCTLQEVEEWN